jgi:hypothetical protein
MAKERFVKVYSQGTMNITEIWVDTETGVNYVWRKEGYAGGLTPLLDKEGKIISNDMSRPSAEETSMTLSALEGIR